MSAHFETLGVSSVLGRTGVFSMAKYKLTKLVGGWAVVMASNSHIMERFDSEEDAKKALEQYENGTIVRKNRPKVWVVDETFVMEPGVGGTMYGEVNGLDIKQYEIVGRFSQEQFDEMLEEYFDEYGHYPE